MKKLTVKEFSRYFSKYSGETVIVTRRGKEIGKWSPASKSDQTSKVGPTKSDVKSDLGDYGVTTEEEERMTNVTTSEEKPVVKKNKVVEMLRAQVREIENRGSELPPIPDIWHKEEEEEEKWIKCDVCKSGRAEKTFYDSGGAGEVEICRQCARMKYAGSMRTFDGYWRKLQDTNVY